MVSEKRRGSNKQLEAFENNPEVFEALKDIVRQRKSEGLVPLNPDELLDYLDGEVATEFIQGVQNRLVYDKDSIHAFLDIQSLPEATEPDESDDAAWIELKNRLSMKKNDFESLRVKRKSHLPHYILHGFLLVACIFLALIGPFSSDNNRPNLQVGVSEVQLNDLSIRDPNTPKVLLDGKDRTIHIKLPTKWRGFPVYLLEIINSENDQMFSGTVNGPKQSLSCELFINFFKNPGTYHFKVFGLRDDERTDLGGFELLVRF